MKRPQNVLTLAKIIYAIFSLQTFFLSDPKYWRSEVTHVTTYANLGRVTPAYNTTSSCSAWVRVGEMIFSQTIQNVSCWQDSFSFARGLQGLWCRSTQSRCALDFMRFSCHFIHSSPLPNFSSGIMKREPILQKQNEWKTLKRNSLHEKCFTRLI